jgi:hypothetical protein
MSRKAPESLRGQAETAVAAAEAALRWFRRADPDALSAARTARLRARGWRESAVAALKDARGPVKTDAADLSFALREAVEHSVSAVSDAARWGVETDAEFAEMAGGLVRGAKALARAAGAFDVLERAAALDEAKRECAGVERRRRAARSAAAESALFVDGVKRSELASRLSSAAEALQQACDALAGSLAE